MDLYQAIQQRCSVRKFEEREIPAEVLQRVFQAAVRAPSWANVQATRWIVVQDAATKARLAETLSPGNPSRAGLANAPVVLALCFLRGRSGFYKGAATTSLGDWGMFDAALAAANLTLAATAEGLGTVHVGALHVELAATILGLPADLQLVELIPLGYPAVPVKPTMRLEVDKIFSYDRYRGQE
jgi:nitroreductase